MDERKLNVGGYLRVCNLDRKLLSNIYLSTYKCSDKIGFIVQTVFDGFQYYTNVMVQMLCTYRNDRDHNMKLKTAFRYRKEN